MQKGPKLRKNPEARQIQARSNTDVHTKCGANSDNDPLTIKVVYEERLKWKKEVDTWKADIETGVNQLNDRGLAIYEEAKRKFANSPEVADFLRYYEALLAGYGEDYDAVLAARAAVEPEPEPPSQTETQRQPEVEIIVPETRRLNPAPAERMLEAISPEIVQPEPPPPLLPATTATPAPTATSATTSLLLKSLAECSVRRVASQSRVSKLSPR